MATENEKVLKESCEDVARGLQHLCEVVLEQESRLKALEQGEFERNLEDELRLLKQHIENVEDAEKRKVALSKLAELCNILGILVLDIEDMEEKS